MTTSSVQLNTHRVNYHILNDYVPQPYREVDVQATPTQLQQLAEEGYLLHERLIGGELLAQLRAALDELDAQERHKAELEQKGFGGLFVRNLLDRHPAFLALVRFEPLLSIARAMLGPQVQIHGNVARVAYPDRQNQQVEWHHHQYNLLEPRPRFFTGPVVLDNLIYLDDISPASGSLYVVPKTHLLGAYLPSGDDSDKPGQVPLSFPAGSVVTMHAGLWHKALPPQPSSGVRRLVILSYSPTWVKQQDKLGGGVTASLLEGADVELRELLGFGTYY